MKNDFKLSEYDYELPSELIAQKPSPSRDHSKLMVLNKKSGKVNHRNFYELADLLLPGDLIVRNNTKVFPARLIGKKEATGGKVEIFLHRRIDGRKWEVIGRNIKIGDNIEFENSQLRAFIESREENLFNAIFNIEEEDFFNEIDKIGLMPLPPYIKRNEKNTSDRENYQTIFAKERGSVAAPTAGLHFTKELDQKLIDKGIEIAEITLHVGLGTFSPIKAEDIRQHKMHSEFFMVKREAIDTIEKKKKNGQRVVCVGTTTARTLETIYSKKIDRGCDFISGYTDIYIYPGYNFKVVDGLVTNFHLPKSSLLLLISAFAGKENVARAYKEAVQKKYRFFSYGDAMLII